MKNLTVILLVLFGTLNAAQSQTYKKDLDKVPLETVYLHTNTTLVFAGEYLYYQFYCILPEAKTLSPISKIGYVDLIDENKKVIFQHKLTLTNGTAPSEFFVPADLPSGNYKLIAYTNWLRNFEPDTFFKADISILNPYLGDQKVFLVDSTDYIHPFPKKAMNPETQNGTGPIVLQVDKKQYGKRNKVTLSLKSKAENGLKGSYSLSVRKKEKLPKAKNNAMKDLNMGRSKRAGLSFYPYLPETRGAFISGKITKDQIKKNPDQKIMLSFPGENSVFKIATTDSLGIFRTQLTDPYEGEEVFVNPLGTTEPLKIQLDTTRVVDYGEVEFYSFLVNEEMRGQILERSINNQIENAYFNNRPDSILQPKPISPFYADEIVTYELDDYTRFSTLRETFVEILEHIWINEGENGNLEFKVRYFLPLQDSGERPLVFLDGAYIDNHEKLLTLPSKAIKTIKIGRNQYLYGSHSFQGIVDISTFEGNASKNYLDNTTQNFAFEQPRMKKNYYQEDYSNELYDIKKRLPDFRNQLIWLPEILPTENNFNINFYTSDISGEFEIVLEGMTLEGIPVSLTESFRVE